MIPIVPILAAVLLSGAAGNAAPTTTARAAPTTTARTRAGSTPRASDAAPGPALPIVPSPAGQRVADWIAASGDNRELPYAVIDKTAASLVLYDAGGKPLGQAPVLIGIASGDDATPGVGSKTLADIGPAEKTTPAGRFLAKFGYAAGRQRVLWVDYANSVAIHPIPADAAKAEKRRERMLSPEADDNRITFGCINVPRAFYSVHLRPLFQRKGGYVYVLPDTKSLEEVFPRLRVHALGTAAQTSASPGIRPHQGGTD